jgi:hypothetical protein
MRFHPCACNLRAASTSKRPSQWGDAVIVAMEVHVTGASTMSISSRGKIMTTVEAPIAEHHHDEGITSLLHRIRSEFNEMPGLRLTPAQAARLWGMERHTSERILDGLALAGFLSKNRAGAYLRASGA